MYIMKHPFGRERSPERLIGRNSCLRKTGWRGSASMAARRYSKVAWPKRVAMKADTADLASHPQSTTNSPLIDRHDQDPSGPPGNGMPKPNAPWTWIRFW